MSRGGDRFFCLFFILFTAAIARAGARKRRRLILRLSVGWLPPDVRPSGACLARGPRVWCSLVTPSRGPPHRIDMKLSVDSLHQGDGFVLFCQTFSEYLSRGVSFS